MKPTIHQTMALAFIAGGTPYQNGAFVTSADELLVVAHQWSRDGESIVAHRTVRVDLPTGDPRTDYRTELFRIQRSGAVSKL